MKRTLMMAALLACASGSFASETDRKLGEQVYQKWCAACHAPGDYYPGTLALRAKYQGALPDALIERKDMSPELVKYFVRNGISIMPFFRKTEISDVELDALANFLSSQNK